LPGDAADRLTSVRTEISGENGLRATIDVAADDDLLRRLEVRAYTADAGPTAPDGRRIVEGWAIRLPVIVDPTHPWDTGGMRYPMNVRAEYRLTAEERPRELRARVAIEAQIWSAFYQMGVAALLVPLACAAAAITRWRRTR
jgi:hypothetical protein